MRPGRAWFLPALSAAHITLQGAAFPPGACAFAAPSNSLSPGTANPLLVSSSFLPRNNLPSAPAAGAALNPLRPRGRGQRLTCMSDAFGEQQATRRPDEPAAALMATSMTRMGYAKVPQEIASAVTDARIQQLTLVILYSKEEDRILLAMKKRGFGAGKYNGFGGKVELRETLLEAALREFEEECGATVSPEALTKRAVLTFVFRGNPKVMQVHLFTGSLSALQGEARETEEMKPREFALGDIPFDTMWPDDVYWFPSMLRGDNFEGSFLFAEDEKTVELHHLSEPSEGLAPDEALALEDQRGLIGADVIKWRQAALRADAALAIEGPNVRLVPYSPEHVKPYHTWMQDEELRRMTGSEALTLEEEEEMQIKWASEYDKATFIVLHKETGKMIGDVNLFFYEDEQYSSELNVMVADTAFRRMGLGKEAVRLMMHYGYRRLGAREFVAKIEEDNEASINMFLQLGFEKKSFSSAFKQHCLVYAPTLQQARQELLDSASTCLYTPALTSL